MAHRHGGCGSPLQGFPGGSLFEKGTPSALRQKAQPPNHIEKHGVEATSYLICSCIDNQMQVKPLRVHQISGTSTCLVSTLLLQNSRHTNNCGMEQLQTPTRQKRIAIVMRRCKYALGPLFSRPGTTGCATLTYNAGSDGLCHAIGQEILEHRTCHSKFGF